MRKEKIIVVLAVWPNHLGAEAQKGSLPQRLDNMRHRLQTVPGDQREERDPSLHHTWPHTSDDLAGHHARKLHGAHHQREVFEGGCCQRVRFTWHPASRESGIRTSLATELTYRASFPDRPAATRHRGPQLAMSTAAKKTHKNSMRQSVVASATQEEAEPHLGLCPRSLWATWTLAGPLSCPPCRFRRGWFAFGDNPLRQTRDGPGRLHRRRRRRRRRFRLLWRG
jgi:hypothetical protein